LMSALALTLLLLLGVVTVGHEVKPGWLTVVVCYDRDLERPVVNATVTVALHYLPSNRFYFFNATVNERGVACFPMDQLLDAWFEAEVAAYKGGVEVARKRVAGWLNPAPLIAYALTGFTLVYLVYGSKRLRRRWSLNASRKAP